MDRLVEKVAWVHVHAGRLLVARNAGRQLFYLPGGRREPGETDTETLTREVREELGVGLDHSTMTHVLTCVAKRDAAPGMLRVVCYTAGHDGPLSAQGEIAELGWFSYADRDRVTDAERQVIAALRAAGQMP